MQSYEYKVVPAPVRGEKARGLKTAPDRFANALATLMNRLGQDGWEYLRAETLPAEERAGLMRHTTVYHNVLVFRRPLSAATPARPGTAAALSVVAPTGEAPRLSAPAAVPDSDGAAPKVGPASGAAAGQAAGEARDRGATG